MVNNVELEAEHAPRNMTVLRQIIIETSYGSFSALSDGTVIGRNLPEEYAHILQLDFAEWQQTYGREPAPDECIDILDIGFWHARNGVREYEEPVPDWREHIQTLLTQRKTIAMNVYREAVFSQGASNLGGLVHGFDRVITQLQKEARENGHGIDWINKHPVCVLFAEQIYHLTGGGAGYATAHAECEAKKEEPTATNK